MNDIGKIDMGIGTSVSKIISHHVSLYAWKHLDNLVLMKVWGDAELNVNRKVQSMNDRVWVSLYEGAYDEIMAGC